MKDPDALVALWGNVMRTRVERRGNSYPDFLDWRAQSKSFEDIGSFDLVLACGEGTSYDVSYVETRRSGEQIPVPVSLGKVTLRIGSEALGLKVSSSEQRADLNQLVTVASGSLPASAISAFAS